MPSCRQWKTLPMTDSRRFGIEGGLFGEESNRESGTIGLEMNAGEDLGLEKSARICFRKTVAIGHGG